MLDGEEGLECDVCVDGIRLKNVSELKYLRCALAELGTRETYCSRRMVSGRRIFLLNEVWVSELMKARGEDPPT